MSEYRNPRSAEEDLSQSSDEKMDTGSESFRSQDTPNSTSSDCEDNVLRLQNPSANQNGALTSPEPEPNQNKPLKQLKPDIFTESFVSKMSTLTLDSPKLENRPKNLGISPPKFSSSLVLTTSHPLMSLSSPDDYPDLIPKKVKEDERELSLSSIEDDKPNSYMFYDSSMNNSKNNLYFSENFTTADSQIIDSQENSIPPDVARVERRRKIIPRFIERKELSVNCNSTPNSVRSAVDKEERDGNSGIKCVEETQKIFGQSTPKVINGDSSVLEYYSGDLDSPDVISSSTQEDRSQYEALADPRTGSVALRPRRSAPMKRRRIQVPPEDDDICSLDSVSMSMDSEDEPPEPEDVPEPVPQEEARQDSDDDTKRSKSTVTPSEESEMIPEYSLEEELRAERSWMRVRSGGTDALCDMKVIEPFKRVLSHGGYGAGGAAVLVFSACHLPDAKRPDYTYVMDNLFLYVMWSLERLVTEEYVVVCLLGGDPQPRLPTFKWLHDCYKLVDRRLRKNLKHLYLVHPTFWLRCVVVAMKPFLSSKFFRKLSYVRSLDELMERVSVEPNAIPEAVKRFDATR